MLSACSTPTHSKLFFEGLEKAWNIFCNGLKINVFPQLAGPSTKIFLPFPQPRSRAEMIAVENSFFGKLFFCTVILAHLSHSPRQSSKHSLEQNLFKISILGIFHIFRFSPECSISHVVSPSGPCQCAGEHKELSFFLLLLFFLKM